MFAGIMSFVFIRPLGTMFETPVAAPPAPAAPKTLGVAPGVFAPGVAGEATLAPGAAGVAPGVREKRLKLVDGVNIDGGVVGRIAGAVPPGAAGGGGTCACANVAARSSDPMRFVTSVFISLLK